MESSSRDTRVVVFSHGQEMKYMDENTLKQPSQATSSTSTPNTNPTSSSSSSSSSSTPKLLKSSASESTTSQAPIYPSNSYSNFPFSSNRSGTAPKISITTTIDSMISNHQNRNVGLSLMTRDLVASPVEDFILGSPLEGFM